MKVTKLLPWVLAGGLAASTIWNIQLVGRLEMAEARLAHPTVAPPGIPSGVVSQLGLSDQQCEMLRNCSMT